MSGKNNSRPKNYIYRPIGNYLTEADIVTRNCLFQALEEQKKTQERIGDILVRRGHIKQTTLDYFIEQVIFQERHRLLRREMMEPTVTVSQNSIPKEENSKHERLNLPSLNFSAPKIIKILLITIATLFLLSILEKIGINWLNNLTSTQFTTRFFGIDEEANFPTLYSTLTLGFCSFLLAIITSINNSINSSYTKFWRGLSAIFLFLAIDESCSIHEILIPLIKIGFDTKNFLYFPWVIPAFILLIVFLIVFRKFIFNLPTKIRNLFLLAGVIYIGGALGMELIGGYLADNSGLETTAYWIATLIEEFLEMFGILIFIYGLLSYIQSHTKEANISLYFHKQKVK